MAMKDLLELGLGFGFEMMVSQFPNFFLPHLPSDSSRFYEKQVDFLKLQHEFHL